MSKKNKNNPKNFYGDQYWQSADYNIRIYDCYLRWMQTLRINSFRWINLPDTCDARFLEFILMTQGVATICHPKSLPGKFFSTRAILDGKWNVYDTPSHWQSYGANGNWRFNVNPKNGVLVYDNMMRLPIYNQLEFFARKLASLDRLESVNQQQQFTPYIILAPREMVNDAKQLMKQIVGGEMAVLGKPELSNIEVTALNTQVPYIGKEISDQRIQIWNQVYDFLGIDHVNEKSERINELEVESNNEPSNLMALDGLNARREAVKKLNDRFGLDVKVVWNKDNLTDKVNFFENPILSDEEE